MIWGLKYDDPKRQIADPYQYWQLWFAWYPVPLKDGRWAWWQIVEYRKKYDIEGSWSVYREAFKEPLKIGKE